MYNVTVYPTKSGDWKWKLSHRKNVLARSDRGYDSTSHAKRSFKRIIDNLKSSVFTPTIEIEHKTES